VRNQLVYIERLQEHPRKGPPSLKIPLSPPMMENGILHYSHIYTEDGGSSSSETFI
jgi:hypothetical protein